MLAITESNRVQLEQFQFQSAFLTYKMLTHKGECLQKKTNTTKKEVSGFPIYTYILVCQPEKW